MTNHTPFVRDGMLIVASEGEEEHVQLALEVDAQQWVRWLEANSSFAFIATDTLSGHMMFHKERRSNGWYWYGHHRCNGRVRRAYLGKSTNVTLAKLQTIAHALFSPAEAHVASSHPPKPSLTYDPLAQTIVNPLLLTKLTVPPLRSSLLVLPHSFNQLQQADGYALTVISAPAGFGKTTLLAQWASMTRLTFAWLSLDENDTDPVRFWTYLVATLDRIMPGLTTKAMPLLRSLTHQSTMLLLSLVLNALNARHEPMLLVIDDYHVITEENRAIHEGITYLLEYLPPQTHLIIASRQAVPLPLARLRAQRQLNEVLAADLRLTQDEVSLFLSCMGVSLTEAELGVLDKQIEGWITGWQLVALSLQRCQDVAGWIASFNGGHRYIEDFLTEEVLNRLTQETLDFLLQTSILDRLTAPLCNALTQTTNSQETLEYLERANLFVEPLDEQRQGYRYHPLFAGALRSRLGQLQPERVKHLYQRASEWCKEQGIFTKAVEYASHMNDFEYFAAVVESTLGYYLEHGRVVTLRRWLDLLPDSVLEHWPWLCVVKAHLLHLTGQQEHVAHYIHLAESHNNALPPESRAFIHSEILVLRALMAAIEGRSIKSLDLCKQALEHLPAKHVFLDVFLLDLGMAYQMSGDLGKAGAIFETLYAQSKANNNPYTLYISVTQLALIYLLQGRLSESIHMCHDTQQFMIEDMFTDLCVTLGIALYACNEFVAAEKELQRCIALHYSVAAVSSAYSILALIRETQGDHTGARQLMNQAVKQVPGSSNWAMAVVHANQIKLWMRQGNLAAVARSLRPQPQLNPSHHPEFISTTQLEYKLILRAHLALLLDSPQEALALLATRLDAARAAGYTLFIGEILVLQSLAYAALSEHETAFTSLRQALELVQAEKYIRIFLDHGAPMKRLLMRLKAHHPHELTSFGQTLLDAFAREEVAMPVVTTTKAATRPRSVAQHMVESLSLRELEILQLLAQGASNQDLAKRLVIALGTVKRHLSNIFMKLGVQSRTQALARATEMKLVNRLSHNV